MYRNSQLKIMKKFKFKINRSQLNALYELLTNSINVHNNTMEHKLIISELIEVHKKLLVKWTYPTEGKQTITLTSPQAISFWLYFNSITFSDPFMIGMMTPILTQIHQQYA